ncbi:sensor histidine kinase [Micromonospora sp. NPDC049559]|uniref:sensor histidine kinase n=1 Tax=Micromonospora sp. NPDC049559 TaxID=3155923 RepID=UPI0034412CEA
MVMWGWRGGWRDPATALGLTALVLVSAATSPPGRAPLDAGGVLLLVLAGMAIALRWRAPVLVLGLATACMVGYELRGYPGYAPLPPVLFALYAAVKRGCRGPAALAAGVIVIGGLVGQLSCDQPSPDAVQRWILLLGWLVAAGVAGELSRKHRAYLDQVEQRAAEAERTREETARRRAGEERLRIARELHDSLTHSISIIKVQAGVAVHLARKRDEPVDAALLAIQQASTEAMRELRATLEVLRDGEDGAGAGGSGLDRMEQLVDGARRAGLPVTVRVSGQPRPLPAPVDRAAYRIIQEALTNVGRHAGPAVTASVRLGYRENGLTVRVDDDGRGVPGETVTPGVGLAGMRERVSALGGSLHAGPRDGGGFTVRAELPLAAS